jgi:DNA-binding Lrp family transcriptional regulator
MIKIQDIFLGIRKKMIKIDKKDRKILYYLLHNSRQPLSILGKKVGLSREVVGYRINRLEKKGIITGYPTMIQTALFGWGLVRYYYTLQFVSPEKKQEIIDYFINSDIVTLVSELEGSYDLQVNMYVSSLRSLEYPFKFPTLFLKFTSFYDQTQKKYRKYFDEQIMTVYHKSTSFDPIFLLGDMNIKPASIPRSTIKDVRIDKLDFKILKKLAVNARIPTVKLAHDLNVTTATIKNRIKRLIFEKIILNFSVNINQSKIGFRAYNVEINLRDYDKKYVIIEYIKNNQYLLEIDESFGRGVDLDFEFALKDITQLHNIINDLSSKFPEAIKNYRYYSHKKVHKYNHIPFN